MSRRIYYTNPKRKRITQEALLQLRQTRRAIDPELLARAREVIARKAQSHAEREKNESLEQVDRKKTLRTVMKFLELKPDNPALRQEIKALFSDGLH